MAGADYGVAKTAKDASWRSLTWTEGAQYVKFANVVVPAGQALVLTASHDGVYTPIINGLQLVRQPDQPVPPAGLLNVQFGVNTTPVKSGPAAYGIATNDVWNLYSRDDGHGGYKQAGGLANLRFADGTAGGSGLTITNAPGAWGSGYPDAMFGTYLYNFNGADLTVTLTNLPAGTYTLYAYGHGEQDTFNSAFRVSAAGMDYGVARTATNASWKSPTWIEGAQYVKFANVVVPPGQPLVLSASHDGINTPIINGLQLVLQPEQPVLFNVQFGVDATPVKSGPAAYGITTNDVWNLYSRDDGHGGYKLAGALTNLTLSDGTAGGAGLTITNAPGAWGSGYPDAMFGTYLYNFNGADLTVTLTNLPAGTYTLYAYGHGEQDSFNSAFRVNAAGVDYGVAKTATNASWKSPTWIEGAQYVKFGNIVVPAGEPLVLTAGRAGANTPIINGLQLVRSSATALAIVPHGGLFTNSINVVLVGTAVGGAEIHYTLDGTDPLASSPVYAGSLQLVAAATVKAALFKAGLPVSGIISARFDRVYALNDGISADWRLRYFGDGYLTDPRVAADADPDHDGATNLQEFIAGSNPLDPLSGFAVSIRLVPSITWASVPGKTYSIRRKAHLSDAQWTVIKVVIATDSVSRFSDEDAAGSMSVYSVEPVR